MHPLADGAMDPVPWFDFLQVLLQAVLGALAVYGVGFLVLDFRRRWTVQQRVSAELDDQRSRQWLDSLTSELEAVQAGPSTAETMVLRPVGSTPYTASCPDCHHPVGNHDEIGRCRDAQCLAMGDDQVCPSALPILHRLDHNLSVPNWSTPSGWVMFCRLCGHRMAHHEAVVSDRLRRVREYQCPDGPPGPFHDGPASR